MSPTIQSARIPIRYQREVEDALKVQRPIVALESVIVAHGLPRPRNLVVAKACEEIVRSGGGVPATMALHEGHLLCGLDEATLTTIAETNDIRKVNLGNLASCLASGGWGATTVATSLWACRQAGLPLLVTGGIGGVHRGFQETFDISSDLTALSRWPVIVVCSGVKSLLDVPATREHLETLGVPVLGWKTDCFPRFYLPKSELPVDARVDSAEEVARIARLHWAAGGAGVLVAAPIPEEAALGEEEMEEALSIAEFERVGKATSDGGGSATGTIRGRDVTPFLLGRLHELTKGRSLDANVALIQNNTRIGTAIALALAGTSAFGTRH